MSKFSSPFMAKSPINNNGDDGRSWLDWAQDGLTAGGMIPAVGAIPDIINTVISTGRAGYAGLTGDSAGAKRHSANAALNAAAIIPVVGQGVSGAKLINTTSKIASKAGKVKTFTPYIMSAAPAPDDGFE